MKLSQIEKRIPQTLTNSNNIIQTHREYARRSSRDRSTRGQENEAWALYKKIPSWGSWGDLSRARYIICPRPPSPAGKILDTVVIPSSCGIFVYKLATSKSVGFFSLSGKASLVSLSAAILFLRSWHVYFPLEFEFHGKSCVE